MAEYIEREPKCEDCIHDGVCYLQEVCNDMVRQLKEFGCDNFKPAADVVEVRHGAWNDKARSGLSVNGYMVCSECDVIIPNCDDKTYYCLYRLNYCPNCGAKMDGKGDCDV